jgi:hypothetical protein
MSDSQLYAQIASLPQNLKQEVADFVAFLKTKTSSLKKAGQRKAGLAKGLIKMKANFDEPVDALKDY